VLSSSNKNSNNGGSKQQTDHAIAASISRVCYGYENATARKGLIAVYTTYLRCRQGRLRSALQRSLWRQAGPRRASCQWQTGNADISTTSSIGRRRRRRIPITQRLPVHNDNKYYPLR